MNANKNHWFDPRNWSFTIHLTLCAIFMVIGTVTSVTILTSRTVEHALTEQIGENFAVQAESLSRLVEAFFLEKGGQVQALAVTNVIKDAVTERNSSYVGSSQAILDEILALDEQWQTGVDDEPLIANIISTDPAVNPAATQLSYTLEAFPDHSEIFITDFYGATVAATSRLSDYYQADEEWWQKAWNEGKGAVYISDPVFDESANVNASLIAMPIFDRNGEVIGIIRSTLVLDDLFSQIISEAMIGQTGHAALFNGSGELLFEPLLDDQTHSEALPADLRQSFVESNGQTHFKVALDEQNEPSIFGYTYLQKRNEEQGSVDHRWFKNQVMMAVGELGWATVVRQKTSDAFVSVNIVIQSIQLVGFLIVSLAAIFAVFFARTITRPLKRLSEAAEEVGKGNLSIHLPPAGNHQIGRLTNSFEKMTGQLRDLISQLTARRDELSKANQELESEITQRKLAEVALQKSNERFRFLSEAANEGIAIHDGHIILEANSALSRIFGYNSTDMIGMNLLKLAMPNGHDIGSYSEAIEVKAQRKEGSLIYVERQDSPDYYEGRQVCVAVIRDITQRKQAEERLQHFAHQLQTAAELTKQINAILDVNQLLRETVSQLQTRFKLYHVHIYLLDEERNLLIMHTGSGEVGAKLRAMGYAISYDQPRSLVARAARIPEVVVVHDVRTEPTFLPNPLLPDTRSECALPLMTANRVLGVLDVQDKQPQRFSQSDLHVFNTLAGQIATALENARLFDELNQTAAKLREMDRLKSEFLASMSHELRTPLNSIIGYSEIMLMGINGPLNKENTEDVQAILNSGRHLLNLINDILDLAKIEAGRMALDIDDVSIHALLDDIKVSHSPILHQKPLRLVFEIQDDIPTIEADSLRLKQILTNLLTNAIKFTDQGSIYLRVRYENGWLFLAVQDEGIGISEEHLSTIFEQFRQVDGSSTRRAEGTGLGLTITNHLVQLHGGMIEVESQLGVGSTFTVRLPVKQENKEQVQ